MARLLAESFEVLAREQPRAYARMCTSLENLVVAIQVDEEHFTTEFSSQRAWVCSAAVGIAARIRTHRRTILDVLDNRQALSGAVLADAVTVVGPLETLLRLHAGLLIYVQGAVRCLGFSPLLRRLRDSNVQAV